jgi:L-2,4-diaminobutyrate decarboxylase
MRWHNHPTNKNARFSIMIDNKKDLLYSGDTPKKVTEDLRPLVDFQEEGLSYSSLQQLIEERLVPHFVKYDRPEFHSLYNAFPEEGAKYGAQVALDYNQGVTSWQVSPGGVMLEELCCQDLCRLFELSPRSDATSMDCGTNANQQALHLALHAKAEREGFDLRQKDFQGFKDPDRLCVLTSKDTHFLLKRTVNGLGLGEGSLIALPVDHNRRVDIQAMRETLAEIQNSRDVFCIVATAGTTSTGSIDPVGAMAELCALSKAWYHVDGVYGMIYCRIPEKKELFAGVEIADSLIWDSHKQMSVPIPSSILLVRRKENIYRITLYSDCFNRPEDPHTNPGLKSPPTTRPLSALPLATSLRFLGLTKVTERLRNTMVAIRTAVEFIKQQPDMELIHEPDTAILCFRIVPDGFPEDKLNHLQQHLYEQVFKKAKRTVSITKLDGETVLRFVGISLKVTG